MKSSPLQVDSLRMDGKAVLDLVHPLVPEKRDTNFWSISPALGQELHTGTTHILREGVSLSPLNLQISMN